MAFWSAYPPYVSAAEKRARAAAAIKRLTKQAGKKGRRPEPIALEGRKIATTFWGKAWCDNLESYADFAYRVERHEIVDPGDVAIVRPVGYERLVLTACHPLYSAAQRYAVLARLERVAVPRR